MNKKYQVFVSSTYEDLIEERKEVVQGILECNCIPAGMELFPASNRTQWEVIKSVIDDCDYYLLIIGGRYGTEGKDEDGNSISYTEMEFDYAVKTNKPIIALLHKYPEKISYDLTDGNDIKRKKLSKFKNKIKNERIVNFWTNKDNLKAATIKSLTNIIMEAPAIGWIRCNELDENKHENNQHKYVFVKAKEIHDCEIIGDYIIDNCIINLSLKDVEVECAQRIIDFVSGAVYRREGSLQKIDDHSFIIVPHDFDMSGDF